MNLIMDIRYYPSKIDNYNHDTYLGTPYNLEDIWMATSALKRFLLKLREIDFRLPGFDHIYISLTPKLNENEVVMSDKADPYHEFFREFYVGISPDFFNNLNEGKKNFLLIEKAVDVIQKYYCESDEEKANISQCAEMIMKNGEDEKIIFKEKKSDQYSVQVIVRVLNNGDFKVYVRIICNQRIVKEIEYPRNLTQDELAFQFGTISIGRKIVLIKPKKSTAIYDFKDIRYELNV